MQNRSEREYILFDELYRRVDITTGIRYNSADRLRFHHRFSQWVVTLVSVALIAIPLFQAMDVPLRASQRELDALEVILAVIVLVYSLLLGNEDNSIRSEKMQSCGLELGRLSRKIYPYLGKEEDPETYEFLSNEYHNILEKYPNHDRIDYKLYKIRNRDKYYKGKAKINYIFAFLMVRFESVIGYWHYLLIIFFVVLTLLSVFTFR